MITVAATGHRPDKLGGYEQINRLTSFARQYLNALSPASVISGMALGWDQAVAAAALDLCIPLTAAVPFEDQESRWPDTSRRRYAELMSRAAFVHVVSPYPGTPAMQLRNRWMVDRCDLLLSLYDGSYGGTHNCLLYANRQKRQILNLWEPYSSQYVSA